MNDCRNTGRRHIARPGVLSPSQSCPSPSLSRRSRVVFQVQVGVGGGGRAGEACPTPARLRPSARRRSGPLRQSPGNGMSQRPRSPFTVAHRLSWRRRQRRRPGGEARVSPHWRIAAPHVFVVSDLPRSGTRLARRPCAGRGMCCGGRGSGRFRAAAAARCRCLAALRLAQRRAGPRSQRVARAALASSGGSSSRQVAALRLRVARWQHVAAVSCCGGLIALHRGGGGSLFHHSKNPDVFGEYEGPRIDA